MKLIDSHAHLTDEKFKDDPDAEFILREAEGHGASLPAYYFFKLLR